MKILIAFLLLLPAATFADRSPVKCGRVLATRMFDRALRGGGEIRLPKACPIVQVPAPYTVQMTSLGQVLLNQDGSVAATFLVPPALPTMAPTSRRVARRAAARRYAAVTGYHRQRVERDGRTITALVED